jgi:SulP family sulfate permease
MFIDCLAIGSILFSGEYSRLHVDVGIKHALVGVVLAQLINGCLSGYSKLITPTGFEVLPFLIPLYHQIEPAMIEDGLSEWDVVTTMLWCSAAVPILSCVFLLLLGAFQLGDLVNFVPQTVLIGLFACIGYSLWAVSFEFSCGRTFDVTAAVSAPTELSWLWEDNMTLKWALTQGLGIALYVASSRTSDAWSPRVFPLYLIGGIAIFQAVLQVKGWSLEEAAGEGWLMAEMNATTPDVLYRHVWSYDNIHLKYLIENFVDLVLAAILGPVLNIVINTTMLNPVLKERADLNTELLLNGKAMLCMSLLSGFPAYVAIVNTNLHINSGGDARWSTVLAGCVAGSFFALPWMINIVRVIPNVVIGGMFVSFGVDFMAGAAKQYDRIKKVEFALVWCMVAVSICNSFTHAMLFGLMGSFVIFIHQYSRVNNIMLESTLSVLMSHSERTMKQEQSLKVAASSVFILRLTGYLYFATVVEISDRIQQRIRRRRQHIGRQQQGNQLCLIRQVVLDFTAVPNMDTSSLLSIATLCEELGALGVEKLHFCGFNNDGRYKRLYTMLSDKYDEGKLSSGFIEFPGDFDRALSVLEDRLLQRLIGSAGRRLSRSLAQISPVKGSVDMRVTPKSRCRAILRVFSAWISCNRSYCEDVGGMWHFILLGCCQRQLIREGTTFAKAGEGGKGVWLLLTGTIRGTVSVNFGEEQQDENDNDDVDRQALAILQGKEPEAAVAVVGEAAGEVVQQWSGNGLVVGASGIHARKQYTVTHSAATDCDTFYISCEHIAQMQAIGAHQAVAALYNIALSYSSRHARVLQRSLLAMEAQTKTRDVVSQLQLIEGNN